MVPEEEGLLETELEQQLVEQEAALASIAEALEAEPQEELLQLREELEASVQAAKESLLHLKRHKLLRHIDQLQAAPEKATEAAARVESGSSAGHSGRLGVSSWEVGDRCSFIFRDGRMYNGMVLAREQDGKVRVGFATPTVDRMVTCRFYLQQRCRFGESCRSSHGYVLRAERLSPYVAPSLQSVELGSQVLALEEGDLWKPAELAGRDGELYTIAFVESGRKAVVRPDAIALSQYAPDTGQDSESPSDTEEEADSENPNDGNEESNHLGLGADFNAMSHAGEMAATGRNTDTKLFATWEQHTRGVASKLMAQMGYQAGGGLGKESQGMAAPLPVKLIKGKRGLDFVSEAAKIEGSQKKKTRGGERSRKRKAAQAAREGQEPEEDDMFGFLNKQLAGGSFELKKEGNGQATTKPNIVTDKTALSERHTLLKRGENVGELRKKMSKLQEMAARNKGDRAVLSAVHRKIAAVNEELEAAESAHATAQKEVQDKERHRKILKW